MIGYLSTNLMHHQSAAWYAMSTIIIHLQHHKKCYVLCTSVADRLALPVWPTTVPLQLGKVRSLASCITLTAPNCIRYSGSSLGLTHTTNTFISDNQLLMHMCTQLLGTIQVLVHLHGKFVVPNTFRSSYACCVSAFHFLTQV